MDAQLKAKWVPALRSEKYKQGTGYLNHEGFCCLGVLCDVSHLGVWIDDTWIMGAKRYMVDGVSSRATLPYRLENRFGLSSVDISVLIEMNDSGKSFSEIADYIEKNL